MTTSSLLIQLIVESLKSHHEEKLKFSIFLILCY